MLTQLQINRLLAHADGEIARAVARRGLKPGRGVSLEGGLIDVSFIPRTRVEDGLRVVEQRRARDLPLQVRGSKLYVALPPIYGAVPTLFGVGLYDQPRPFYELADGDEWRVWLYTSFYRVGVDVPTDGGDPVTVGLGMLGLTNTVELLPLGAEPVGSSPVGGGPGIIEPYEGTYEEWREIGSVIAGEVTLVANPLLTDLVSAWGGLRLALLPGFDEDGFLSMGGGFTAP